MQLSPSIFFLIGRYFSKKYTKNVLSIVTTTITTLMFIMVFQFIWLQYLNYSLSLKNFVCRILETSPKNRDPKSSRTHILLLDYLVQCFMKNLRNTYLRFIFCKLKVNVRGWNSSWQLTTCENIKNVYYKSLLVYFIMYSMYFTSRILMVGYSTVLEEVFFLTVAKLKQFSMRTKYCLWCLHSSKT